MKVSTLIFTPAMRCLKVLMAAFQHYHKDYCQLFMQTFRPQHGSILFCGAQK